MADSRNGQRIQEHLVSPESMDASKDLWGGTSLVFQWLRTPHSQHRGPDSILGQGTRFCRQQLRQTQPKKKKKKRTFGVFSGKKGEKKGRRGEGKNGERWEEE